MSELFVVPSGCNAKYTKLKKTLPFVSILLGRFQRGTVPAPWDFVSIDGIGILVRHETNHDKNSYTILFN